MKKNNVFGMIILIAAIIFTMPACSNRTDTKASSSAVSTRSSNFKAPDMPDDMDHEPPQGLTFDISNKDIFEKGYYAVQFDSFAGAYFSWSSKNNSGSDIEWSVYLSDKELSEEEIKELSKTKRLHLPRSMRHSISQASGTTPDVSLHGLLDTTAERNEQLKEEGAKINNELQRGYYNSRNGEPFALLPDSFG